MEKQVKCWEALECHEEDCPAFKAEELRCWLVSGTHCRQEIQGKFIEKMEMCLGCDPFLKNMDVESMQETLKVLEKQFSSFKEMVEERDRELESTSLENSGTGVPWLSRIPILKWFFSKRRKAKGKTQLLIFVRPRVMY